MSLLNFLRANLPFLSAGVLLTFLSSFGQTFFISIFAGEIRGEFGLSHGQWGGIYTLGTAASAVVMLWAGALTDRLRVRVLGAVILLMLAVAALAMALNPVVWLLPVVIFALRFTGQGMTSHMAVVAMSRWFIAARGRALAIANLGFSVGEATLPLTFVALMTVLDWRVLWLAAAAIVLAGLPVLLRLLREERTPQSHAREDNATGMLGKNWTRRQMLRHWLFWFVVPAVLGPGAFNTAFIFQQVHYAAIKGWAHVELVALFPVYTMVSVLSMVASGWALDRFGTARLMPLLQIPMVAAFIVFAVAQTPAHALVGLIFLAMTTGANATVPNAFWAEFFGTAHLGAIKAVAAALMVLGSAIGPGLTGVLIDLGVGLEAQYFGVALYFVITTGLLVVGVGRARRLLPAAP